MRQNRAAFRELDIYFVVRSWVDCIINMSGFDLRQAQRFLLVHIGDPSSNQATTPESQVIHMIQELFGQTLERFPLFVNRGDSHRPANKIR